MTTNPYGPYIVPDSSAFSTAFYTKPPQAASAGSKNSQGGGGLSGLINKLFGGGLYGGGDSGSSSSLGALGRKNLEDNIRSGGGGILQDNVENNPSALAAFDPARYWQMYHQDPAPVAQDYWTAAGNPNGYAQFYPPPGVTEANLSAGNVDSWGTPTGFKNNLIQSVGNWENGYGFTASRDPAPTIYYPENSWGNLIANATPPGVQAYGTAAYNPFNGLGGNDFQDFGSASSFDALNNGGY